MASKLLNVLTNIENDRRYLIDVANNAGYSISENAKLRQLDTAITAIKEQTEIPSNGIPEEYIIKHDWVRPPEWVDCHQILLDTERVKIGNTSNYYEPYMIIMLKADGPTTTFYKSVTSINNGTTGDCIGYSALLTSDGTFYNTNTVDITHTWDTSKDIVVDDGEFPGTYRWVIYFGQSNQSVGASQKLIRFLPAVEIIVDATNCSNQNYSYTPVCFFRQNSTSAGDGALNTTLLNVEVFNAGASLSLSGGLSNPYVYFFGGCTNLRNLDFHGLTGSFSAASSSAYMFRNCYRLRHIDLSLFTCAFSGTVSSSFYFTNCFSLIDFKGPHTTQSLPSYSNYMYSVRLGYNPQLELVQLDLGENTSGETNILVASSTGYERTYVPVTTKFIGADYFGTMLPFNWNGHSYWGNKLYSDAAYPNTNTSVPSVPVSALNREVLDYSNVLSLTNKNNSSYSVYKSGTAKVTMVSSYSENIMYTYNGVFNFPEDIVIRLDFYGLLLSKENVIRLFNALADLTQDDTTTYNPNIVLNPLNIEELTSEELAIATNKGWTVLS